MPTLKEMIAAENAKRANKKPGLLSALQNAGQVIDQGLLGGRIGQIPQRATEMYQGLLNAPAELAALASPDMAQRFNRAMKNPAPIDRDKAMSTAMDFLQTSTPAGGVAGMFIGKGAKTWDAIKAQQAEELLGKGVDPREVWQQTGTMRGVDKALRQEIPDNAAILNDMGAWSGVAGEAYKHDPLYAAYPDLAGMQMRLDPEMTGGKFSGNMITSGTKNGNPKSTTAHEFQHAIQQREGWEQGGSPDQMRQILGGGELTGLYSPQELNNAYRNLAGETEARLTQARMNMTMQERMQSYPPDMFDVPASRQIVRKKK